MVLPVVFGRTVNKSDILILLGDAWRVLRFQRRYAQKRGNAVCSITHHHEPLEKIRANSLESVRRLTAKRWIDE